MKFDLGKAIKKASITLAQVVVGAVLGFGFVKQALAALNIDLTADQIMQIQLAVAGVIGGGLEFLRSVIKQKFNLAWL